MPVVASRLVSKSFLTDDGWYVVSTNGVYKGVILQSRVPTWPNQMSHLEMCIEFGYL